MSHRWRIISEEQARQHELYGIGGWLLMFAGWQVLGIIIPLGHARGEAHQAGISLTELLSRTDAAIAYLKLSLYINFLSAGITLALLFSKHRSFRPASIALLILTWPTSAFLGAVFTPGPGLGFSIASGFLPWVMSSAIWGVYLQRSERVRVTYEHTVRADRPPTPTPDASPSRDGHAATDVPAGAPSRSAETSRSVVDAFPPAEEHWATALAELEGPSRRPGVWARSFAEAQGNEVAAKVFYLRARAATLAAEQQARLDEAASAEAAALAAQRELQLAEEHKRLSLLIGQCPNSECKQLMPMTRTDCPQCGAIFGPDGWKLTPVRPVR